MSRPLDRPTLSNVNSEYSDSCSSNSSSGSGPMEWDENKMHRLVNSWRLAGNNTAIARVFRRMIACGGKMESLLIREMISSSTENGSFYTNITAPITRGNFNGIIFRRDSTYHYIRQEALDYYITL